MTFKIVVLSLVLGIWGLDARSQNEEPDFSGQSEGFRKYTGFHYI